MATIVKTTAGTWKAVIRKRGWPTQAHTFRLKSDAMDWARTTEDEIVRGVFVHASRTGGERMTVAEALDRYLSEVTPTKRRSTQRVERRTAAPLHAALGGYSLAAVTPKIVATYRDQRLTSTSKRTGRPLANNTVRLELALLGHLYTIAIKEWGVGLQSNPVSMIRRPSPGTGRTRRLVGDEERRLLAACDKHSNPMFAAIVRLALYTAMRHTEIISLHEDQIDLHRRVVRLTETKNSSERTVPLSTAAVDVLSAALKCPLRIGSSFVFPGEPARNGSGMRRPYVINRTWSKMLRIAGIENFHFHDLRHEAVSRLVELGLSDQEVSAVSGHKSMQMVRRYTHLRAEDLASKLG